MSRMLGYRSLGHSDVLYPFSNRARHPPSRVTILYQYWGSLCVVLPTTREGGAERGRRALLGRDFLVMLYILYLTWGSFPGVPCFTPRFVFILDGVVFSKTIPPRTKKTKMNYPNAARRYPLGLLSHTNTGGHYVLYCLLPERGTPSPIRVDVLGLLGLLGHLILNLGVDSVRPEVSGFPWRRFLFYQDHQEHTVHPRTSTLMGLVAPPLSGPIPLF